jgi:GNAT superfamily N-acetyltransferase
VTDGLVRRARAEEAAALSALAMRSKAHWGYSQEFLEIVRPMLTFSQQELIDDHVYVLDGPYGPTGMYRLLNTPPQGTLEDLWVDPEAIGSGIGRRLFDHALLTAAGLGLASLLIESDPNAEGFYLAMGAERIGERDSASGRALPLLAINTPAQIARHSQHSSPSR